MLYSKELIHDLLVSYGSSPESNQCKIEVREPSAITQTMLCEEYLNFRQSTDGQISRKCRIILPSKSDSDHAAVVPKLTAVVLEFEGVSSRDIKVCCWIVGTALESLEDVVGSFASQLNISIRIELHRIQPSHYMDKVFLETLKHLLLKGYSPASIDISRVEAEHATTLATLLQGRLSQFEQEHENKFNKLSHYFDVIRKYKYLAYVRSQYVIQDNLMSLDSVWQLDQKLKTIVYSKSKSIRDLDLRSLTLSQLSLLFKYINGDPSILEGMEKLKKSGRNSLLQWEAALNEKIIQLKLNRYHWIAWRGKQAVRALHHGSFIGLSDEFAHWVGNKKLFKSLPASMLQTLSALGVTEEGLQWCFKYLTTTAATLYISSNSNYESMKLILIMNGANRIHATLESQPDDDAATHIANRYLPSTQRLYRVILALVSIAESYYHKDASYLVSAICGILGAEAMEWLAPKVFAGLKQSSDPKKRAERAGMTSFISMLSYALASNIGRVFCNHAYEKLTDRTDFVALFCQELTGNVTKNCKVDVQAPSLWAPSFWWSARDMLSLTWRLGKSYVDASCESMLVNNTRRTVSCTYNVSASPRLF